MLILNHTQDKLNDSLKREVLLEHELETEKRNKSMMQMELDTLTAMINESDKNRVESDSNVLIKDCKFLTNKIYKLKLGNIDLKQKLKMSNCHHTSYLMANQYKYPEKMNFLSSMLNSLKEQTIKLEKESLLLVKILRAFIILAKKYLGALDHTKQFNITGLNDIQQLVKEISHIKSQMHKFVDRNEIRNKLNNDQENTNPVNQESLEIHHKLVEVLEVENDTLHKNLKRMNEK